ncbi:MAG: DUF1788 domain-containing protein [Thermoanaerobaculia bacterium]
MSESLTARMNQILPKITSDSFLRGQGIGNEVAFHIFDYPAEEELPVREHIQFLLDQIPKKRPGLRVVHVNLLDFLVDYLRDRKLLDKAFELQRSQGDEALTKALAGVLHEEKIARRFGEVARPHENELVLVSGVGSAYPLMRSHTLLSNLHAIMGQTPLVLFYPGRYDKMTLRLFGKVGLAGGPPEDRRKPANYYRAFRLID